MIQGYLIPATIIELYDNLLKVRIDKDFNIIKGNLKRNQVYTVEEDTDSASTRRTMEKAIR